MTEFDDTVKYELDSGHYITLESNGGYHVWIPGVTHATCDYAYFDLSIAIARCDYVSRENVRNLKPNTL